MTLPSPNELIAYLVDRHFPEYVPSLTNLLGGIKSGPSAPIKKQMEAFRAEIKALPYEKQLALYEQERNAALKEKAEAFFESPDAKADLEYWSKAAYWTLNEAVALTVRKEPKVVTHEAVEKYHGVSDIAKTYRKTLELAYRARKIKELPEPLPPIIFLEWADRHRISLPEQLVQSVKKHSAVIKDWSDTLASLEPGKSVLERSPYWNKFSRYAVQAVTDYPKWRQTQYKIQKAANLQEWLQNYIGANTREAQIIKKIMTDIFQELK